MKDSDSKKAFGSGLILHIIFTILVYLSWHWPKTQLSASLAILAALLLAWICRTGLVSKKKFYLSGCVINALGFYWLADTVSFFGGFPEIFGFFVYLLFIALSSFQFVIFAYLYNNLPKVLGLFCLPLAWFAAEFISPRIFPWELATPLIAIPVLSQVADIAGSYFVSFLLLLSSGYLIKAIASQVPSSRLINVLKLVLILACWLGYGQLVLKHADSFILSNSNIDLAVVQANVEVVQQGDMAIIKQNKEKYILLTKDIGTKVDLVIWPEAVMQDWIHVDTGNVNADLRVPYFGSKFNLLTGALTFESQQRFFNSALLIKADGTIPQPYHKRILMPFGEYMPFSEVLPFLNEVNKNLALFTPGSVAQIYQIETEKLSAKFSPLICYEDLMPRLSRESVNQGANFLVNLTNDAWFGSGPAAVHHSLIASYRAIENKRYLVRSTNSGLTDIIDPFGRTVGDLEPGSEGILLGKINAAQGLTFYTDYMDPGFYWLLAILLLALATISALMRLKLR